jgi:hypothetical protein
LRGVFEKLGYEIVWYDSAKIATLGKNGVIVKLQVGSDIVNVNGKEQKWDVPPMVINDRFMIPLRSIGEIGNVTVDWVDSEKLVVIATGGGSVSTEKPAEKTPEPVVTEKPAVTEKPVVKTQEPVVKTSSTVFRAESGSKYHVDGCRYLKTKIKLTVDEAKRLGLEPCSVCNPPLE